MPILGFRPFARTPATLVRQSVKTFPIAILESLKGDPDRPPIDVLTDVMRYFEPRRLSIGEPTSTEISWSAANWKTREGVSAEYLHQAHVPYTGTKWLWKLAGAEPRLFSIAVHPTSTKASFRLLNSKRHLEYLRYMAQEDIQRSRIVAGSQAPMIDQFRTRLLPEVEHYLRNNSIKELREEARLYKEMSDRASKHL